MDKLRTLLFLKLCICGINVLADDKVNTFEFLMPNVYPHRNEIHFCTAIRIRGNFYIVGFNPKTYVDTVHHIYLYGCSEPGSNQTVWTCDKMQRNNDDHRYEWASPCRYGPQIVYAWAGSTQAFRLPEGVGFFIGAKSQIKYLVLQVHYAERFPEDEVDSSGVVLNYTKKFMSRQAAVLLLGTRGRIPAKKVEYMETACAIHERKTIYPFAFRVHTHSLGRVVAGFVIRQEEEGDRWTSLGKMDPQLPQMFYSVNDNAPIRYGDIVAARCTMNNTLNYDVRIGTTNKDEVCHFYLLYWVEVDDGTPLQMMQCISPGPPHYYWSRASERFDRIPDKEASTL